VLVLRCDDCVTYHTGSIVIPHLRRAMARLEELAAGPTSP
jgi:hypothetical protein